MRLRLCTLFLAPWLAAGQDTLVPLPGTIPGGYRLHTGWKLRPAGRQIPLDTFPMAARLLPDREHAAILHAGYRPPTLRVIDTKTGATVSTAEVPDAFLGLALSPQADAVYIGGGAQNAVFELGLSGGKLRAGRTLRVFETPGGDHFTGDVVLSPDGTELWAADLYDDAIVIIDRHSGAVVRKFRTGRRPYRILFSPDGARVFTTSWTDGSIQEHEPATGRLIQTLVLGPHATDMVWLRRAEESKVRDRIFVTASNTNSVFVVQPNMPGQLRTIERVNVAMTPRQPVGMTPSAISVSEDNKLLYVTCSDANAVAVVDITAENARVTGFVPSGWYPTASVALSGGGLLILNGKGDRTYPNPKGPQPTDGATKRTPAERQAVEYVGRIQTGTASLISAFDDRTLADWSRTVLDNSPYRDALLDDAGAPRNSVVPSRPGASSPIQHVLYIIKENRTYDQVLGDLEQGNGDPSLTLFGESVTPNQHKLASEFVVLDNFYVNADVSADGHQWSSSAISNDFTSKIWPNRYAARGQHSLYFGQFDPVSRGEETSTPPNGFIWEKIVAAGLSFRNYGYFTKLRPVPQPGESHIASVQSELLGKATDLEYRGYDLDYPDVERARAFLDDLKRFEKAGALPRFMIMRLGNDHTQAMRGGKIAPESMVADNDAALGMIVEALSHSRFWKETAIFVLEDDAQNGPDHIDSHRSPAYVISPWTRGRGVDSNGYNTVSMLRTMELILGIGPLTMFDAAASPMYTCFRREPDPRPYQAERPRIPLDRRNPLNTALAVRSERMDFSEADRVDDDELNDVLWRAIKGTETPPVVAGYLRLRGER